MINLHGVCYTWDKPEITEDEDEEVGDDVEDISSCRVVLVVLFELLATVTGFIIPKVLRKKRFTQHEYIEN